jgi:beta-lactam-binding protein with PASTA domain
MSAEKTSSEKHPSSVVQVPYLLNEPTTLAEKELKAAGLSWKISGSTRQPNYVKSQNPEPGKSVAKGTVVDLFCETGRTP